MRQSPTVRPANYINHFAVCVDRSYSMRAHARALVQAMDNYVRFLAQLSSEQEQETRITLYTFSSYGQEQCLFYDKDVLRMPSMEGLYHPDGNTALIDCTMMSIDELEQTATLHGDHSFWVTTLSDGQENDSKRHGSKYEAPRRMAERIARLPENWTTTAFGPNAYAVQALKKCGFPEDNISVWDTTSAAGIEQVGQVMRDASVTFMKSRASGVRGFNRTAGGLFRVGGFTAADVRTRLTPVTPDSYFFLDVGLLDRDPGSDGAQIDRFYERVTKHPYPKNRCYYQLGSKAVKVQDYKEVMVEANGVLYSGTLEEVRSFVGLPDATTSVKGDMLEPGIFVFIQSTSMNRKLFPGTRLLVMR